jgi:hypothetical protein
MTPDSGTGGKAFATKERKGSQKLRRKDLGGNAPFRAIAHCNKKFSDARLSLRSLRSFVAILSLPLRLRVSATLR